MRNQMLFCSNFSFLEDSYLILKQKACFITFSNFYISCDVISKKKVMPVTHSFNPPCMGQLGGGGYSINF